MESSDQAMLEQMRKIGPQSVIELGHALEVTATAVRQRLNRLMAQGLVTRITTRNTRGRPSHRYSLTEKARRAAGNNFADLAEVLWDELRGIKDVEVRRGLLTRVAERLADRYADRLHSSTPAGRMEEVEQILNERRIPVTVETRPDVSQLTVLSCPYPELAEKDRGICAVERMLFSKLVAAPVNLAECRLDGHDCCRFQTGASADILAGLST